MRDDMDRDLDAEARTDAVPPADSAARRIGWLRLAGVASHVLRLAPGVTAEQEEAALDVLCEATEGPVFRAAPGVFAFRPHGSPGDLAGAIAAAAGAAPAALEEIAPPPEPEAPSERRRLAFVAPTAETLSGPSLVLDAGLALATAAAAARAVETEAEAAAARVSEAAERLAERLDALGPPAPPPEVAESLARIETRLAEEGGDPATVDALAALAARLDASDGRFGGLEDLLRRVSRALDDVPDVRRERDGLLMYAADMRFILDNLDGQATRLARLVERAESDVASAQGPDAAEGLAAVVRRLDALESRVEAALDARDASAEHVRAALAELLAAERRRRVAEMPGGADG